jgi:hypothetical protein
MRVPSLVWVGLRRVRFALACRTASNTIYAREADSVSRHHANGRCTLHSVHAVHAVAPYLFPDYYNPLIPPSRVRNKIGGTA